MKDNLFDDFVREKLEHYDSGAPMHLWQKIQPQIREEDDEDSGAFIWFRRLLPGILLLLGISGISYFLLTRNNTAENTTIKNLNTDNSISNANNSTQNDNKINNTATLKTAPAQTYEAQKDEQNPDDHFSKNAGNASLTTAKIPDDNSKEEMNSAATSDHIQGNKRKRINLTDDGNEVYPAPAATNSNSPSLTSFREQLLQKMNWNKMSLLNPKKSMGALMEQMRNSGAVVNGCPTIYGPRRNSLYLEIYASPDNNFRSFQSFGNQTNYLDQRKDQEKNNISYSAGIRVAKNLGENLVGKTGINYSQINEHLNYVNEKETKLVQIITIRTIINAPGDTLFINDTSYFEQQGTRIRKTYNRYRFIDVPLILSYEFNPESSLTVAVNGGLIFNIAAVYSGEILDTTYAPVKINTNGNSPVATWKKSIGLGLYGSVGFYKRVTDRMQIMFEPYIRYNLKNVNKNQAVVNQRYTTTGIQLGVRFDIHKRQRWEK